MNTYKSLGGEATFYEPFASPQARLKKMYARANVDAVEAMAGFVCRKE